mmetsp:Transcript_41774/g.97552  ORF Transcript_41774/g.97552 Transcript_41774/m.97552 type:complete len:370 (-) Transcript_41774:594-1703(-)
MAISDLLGAGRRCRRFLDALRHLLGLLEAIAPLRHGPGIRLAVARLHPAVLQGLGSGLPLARVPCQHRQEEVRHLQGLGFFPAVLLLEDALQRPHLQLLDVLELSRIVEEVLGVAPRQGKLLRWQVSEQLGDEGQVVFLPIPVLPLLGVEEVVARRQLEEHAGCTPDICRLVPLGPNDYLRRSILPRLNVIRHRIVCLDAVPKIRQLREGLFELKVLEAISLSDRRYGLPWGCFTRNIAGCWHLPFRLRISVALALAVHAGRAIHHLCLRLTLGHLRFHLLCRSLRLRLGVFGAGDGVLGFLLFLHSLLLAFRESLQARLLLLEGSMSPGCLLQEHRHVVAAYENILELHIRVDDTARMDVLQAFQRVP